MPAMLLNSMLTAMGRQETNDSLFGSLELDTSKAVSSGSPKYRSTRDCGWRSRPRTSDGTA